MISMMTFTTVDDIYERSKDSPAILRAIQEYPFVQNNTEEREKKRRKVE
jgi:hypothetical protein